MREVNIVRIGGIERRIDCRVARITDSAYGQAFALIGVVILVERIERNRIADLLGNEVINIVLGSVTLKRRVKSLLLESVVKYRGNKRHLLVAIRLFLDN